MAEPRVAGGTASTARKKWPWIAGAVAVILAIAATYVLLRPTPGAHSPVQPDFVVNPGKWIARRDVVEIVYPRVPPETARQMELMFENDPDPEECIAEDVARNPGVRLFDPRGEARCTLTAFSMTGGRMSGYLTCPLPGVTDGSVMQIAFRGRYTRTLIDIENDISISRPGSLTRLRARDITRYAGPTCSRPQTPAPAQQ